MGTKIYSVVPNFVKIRETKYVLHLLKVAKFLAAIFNLTGGFLGAIRHGRSTHNAAMLSNSKFCEKSAEERSYFDSACK